MADFRDDGAREFVLDPIDDRPERFNVSGVLQRPFAPVPSAAPRAKARLRTESFRLSVGDESRPSRIESEERKFDRGGAGVQGED